MDPLNTSDGSRTLHSARYGETYRSRHGAISESRHVFLAGSTVLAKLTARQQDPAVEGDVVRVLEVGFGTGLNFLVTACAALGAATAWPAGAGPRLHYTALENDLPPLAALAQLDYEALLAPCSLPTRLFEHLAALGEPPPEGNHRLRFEDEHRLTLDLVIADAKEFAPAVHAGDETETGTTAHGYDAIYLDAFSPQANPDMWSADFLGRLAGWLAPGGSLVTFSVSGEVRRRLGAAGLDVRKVPGPAGGKREALVARKPPR